MTFLLSPFVDSLLVLSFTRLPFSYLKDIVIVELSHFVWILEEILLKIAQLILDNSFSLVFVNFASGSGEAFVASPVSGPGYCVRHQFI